MKSKQKEIADTTEEKNHTVLIRDLAEDDLRLLEDFKQTIGEKTSSKAMVQLLHTNKQNKEEISRQRKEIERLSKKLAETQNQLSRLQNQVKEMLEAENRLASL